MFLLPTGAILARYYKIVFPHTWFKVSATSSTTPFSPQVSHDTHRFRILLVYWGHLPISKPFGHSRSYNSNRICSRYIIAKAIIVQYCPKLLLPSISLPSVSCDHDGTRCDMVPGGAGANPDAHSRGLLSGGSPNIGNHISLSGCATGSSGRHATCKSTNQTVCPYLVIQ